MDRLFIIKVAAYIRCTFSIPEDVANFIACQVALESDFGESKLAKDYCNFIGMKVPFVRISTCTNYADVNSTFAHYNGIQSCLLDYFFWLQFQKPLRNRLENLSLFKPLLENYCPEKDYISRIEKIYNQFINSKS